MKSTSRTAAKSTRLREVLQDARTLLVVLQDFPDPDAIGAACALKEIARVTSNTATSLACAGTVGRAENRALVSYLGLNLLRMDAVDLSSFDRIALVDTQPGTGNNRLPDGVVPHIVIDHHPIRGLTRSARFYDVRSRYGSTSTILYEHLESAGIEPSIPLATALLYGIRSDTSDLGREATQADIDAFLALYPRANKRKLGQIGMAVLPRQYFSLLAAGLGNAVTYGKAVASELGDVENPDMIGEVADLLLRNEESTWALCCGYHGGRLLISVRTSEPKADAGRVVKRVVGPRGTGGGHAAMAGGQIVLSDPSEEAAGSEADAVVERFIKALRLQGTPGQRLVTG